MKKILSIIGIITIVLNLNAQQTFKEVKTTKQMSYSGLAAKGDTIIRGASKNYDYYTSTLFNTVQSQVETDTITGKPKVKLYLLQSWDYVKWYYVDSTITLTGGTKGITAKATVFAPFVRLSIKGIDSVQKTLVVKVLTNLKVE